MARRLATPTRRYCLGALRRRHHTMHFTNPHIDERALSTQQRAFPPWTAHHVLKGKIRGDDRITLYATRPNIGNSWLRILHAKVQANEGRIVITGTFRTLRLVRGLTATMLGFAGLLLTICGVGLASALLRDQMDQAATLATGLLAIGAGCLALCGLLRRAMRMSRASEDWVLRCLSD
jgi:hypothetical protein